MYIILMWQATLNTRRELGTPDEGYDDDRTGWGRERRAKFAQADLLFKV